jgi:hypothetical protein
MDGARHFAHKSDSAAAIDQAHSGAGQNLAQVAGGKAIGLVIAERRAAIDADGFDIMLGQGHCGYASFEPAPADSREKA